MRRAPGAVAAIAALALFWADGVAQTANEEIETVLVTGEQPGPGLWKVSRGDHVLWILGGSGALPKGMTWRSQQVERLVAASQEVIYQGTTRVSPDIGLFRGLTLLPSLLKAGKNPDGEKLKDVLPPPTYAKWLVLREKYIGKDDSLEKWRPTFALLQLRNEAFKKSGLSFGTSARSVVDSAARKSRVKITTLPAVERNVHVEDPRRLLKEASKMQFSDAECFDRGVDQLERRLGEAKLAANAWSTGDVDALRRQEQRNRAESGSDLPCEQLMLNAVAGMDDGSAKKTVDTVKEQVAIAERAQEWNWMNAAQKALAVNESTFAILPMNLLLRPDGYVAKLRAAGYDVEEP